MRFVKVLQNFELLFGSLTSGVRVVFTNHSNCWSCVLFVSADSSSRGFRYLLNWEVKLCDLGTKYGDK
jgi:hypothetical protein